MVCSGDAGVYGMAGLMYEVGRDYPKVEIQVIPGVTAALGGSALLGAPLGHDFCVISLSDLLTPWEMIEKRLEAAAEADFVLCLYNPAVGRAKTIWPGPARSCCGTGRRRLSAAWPGTSGGKERRSGFSPWRNLKMPRQICLPRYLWAAARPGT